MPLSAAVGSFTTGTGAGGTTVVVSGLSFQPSVVFFWHNGRTNTTDSVGRLSHQRGFGVAVSTSQRGYASTMSQDTTATMLTKKFQDDTQCVGIMTNAGALDGLLDLQSMDSGGFTLVVDDQFATSYRVHYLAIGGSDITNVAYGQTAKNTGTGTQDFTGPGFQPDFVLLFGSQSANISATIQSDSALTIGGADAGGRQFVLANGSNDSATTSQSTTYCTDAECYINFNAAIGNSADRGTFTQMLSNGFQINWTEQTLAQASAVQWVAIKGGRWRIGSLLSQTSLSTTVVSGVGFVPAGAMLFSHGKTKSTSDTVQDDDMWSVGAFAGTSNRRAMAVEDQDNAADAVVGSSVEHDSIYIHMPTTAASNDGLMDIQSIDADGFTTVMTDADPAQSFIPFFTFGSQKSLPPLQRSTRVITRR